MGEINRERLGQFLRTLRLKAGLTQPELVMRLSKYGVETAVPTISGWETGKTSLPFGKFRVIHALCGVFEIDPLALYQAAGIELESTEEKPYREQVSEMLGQLTDDQLVAAADYIAFLKQRSQVK